MADPKKKGLGKGLGALLGAQSIGAVDAPAAKTAAPAAGPLPDGSRLLYLDPTELTPNPKQPRHVFREEALEELCASIRRDGLQEPVIVRPAGAGYELVSGERRVRASIMADLKRIPAVCRDVSDRDMLRLGLIENIQREDLSAIEQARAYQDLVDEFGWTQEQLAAEVGKKRATVTNTLRLLNLPEAVQQMVADGELSMGHARALLGLTSANAQIAAARRIARDGLSVRQTEKLATSARPRGAKAPVAKDPNVAQIEDALRRALGTKVALRLGEGGRGVIEVAFFSYDDLERLLKLMQKPER